MSKKYAVILFSIFLLSIFITSYVSFLNASTKKSDPWKKWLDEVDLIITKAEKSVFKSLETEEDRKRFQKSFWIIRDRKPETPQNEYMIEFYSRRQYAESHLGGVNSDRGRFYILLGKPLEKKNFSGYEKVVDCELWIYKGEGRSGLPPFMYLIFFKPRNFGNYKLFHPGPHTSLDILSPGYKSDINSRYQAYQILRMDFPELARATLSVIPGEADPAFGQSLTYSGTVFTQIFTLPEKEVDKNYLRNFASLEGIVDVTYSTKAIRGKGNISISENRGFKFLNYSVIPDIIHTIKTAYNSNLARINVNLRIEDLEGKIIHQQEREIDLKIDDSKKKVMLEERKLVFKDFAPIIEGEFNVSITFSNKSTEEFFVYEERINITDKTVPVMVGFKVGEISSDNFIPFSTENYKVFSDPRSIFNKSDSIEGIIFTEQKPEIHLTSIEDENDSIEIRDIVRRGNLFVFRQPLKDIKSDNYFLSIKDENGEIYRKIISVLPFEVKKPVDFERSEVPSSEFNYIFVMAQEYLNKGDVDKALEHFKKLPEELWNSTTLPVIARAYYIKKDYEKVVELLEKRNIVKNYSVILLLANSSLELKKLQKAAEYFEMLRNYGDTVKINRVLGAIYYSLGEREKAKIYWESAKNLEKKTEKKDFDKYKEQ